MQKKNNRLILLFSIAIVLGLLFAFRLHLDAPYQDFHAFKISTNSMSPIFIQGDLVLVSKRAYRKSSPQRGDIIAIDTSGLPVPVPGAFYLERIVALPGESLSIRSGKIFIDGKELTAPSCFRELTYLPVPTTQLPLTENEPFQVPQGCYFVMEDNSTYSNDSRHWGPILKNNIVGRAFAIYFPFKRSRIL